MSAQSNPDAPHRHEQDGPPRPLARQYLRVSLDPSGRERSTEEQDADNRHQWPDLDFNGEAYSDVSISASRLSTKARGGFDRLMADLRSGGFGAGVLVMWESSRGSRRVAEWCELLDLCEAAGVEIAVTTHGRRYRPGVGRDRRSLLEDAVDSEYESSKMSDRIGRAAAANAAAGMPSGPCPIGYRRLFDERTKRFKAQEPDPETAPHVREAFAMFVRGASLKAVSDHLNDRGVKGYLGAPMAPTTLRGVLSRRTYIGERTHHGTVYPAVWEPLVSRATFLAAQARLAETAERARAGTVNRPGKAAHLCSLMAPAVVCDVCAGPLTWKRQRHGKGPAAPRIERYQCRKGCVMVTAADLDELVTAVVLEFLALPDQVADLLADDAHDERLAAARTALAEVKAEHDDLAARVVQGELSAGFAAKTEPGILQRIEQAQALVDELGTPSRLRDLIEPGPEVAKRWNSKTTPITAKREVVKIVCVPAALGQVRITKSARRGPVAVPVTERVKWRKA